MKMKYIVLLKDRNYGDLDENHSFREFWTLEAAKKNLDIRAHELWAWEDCASSLETYKERFTIKEIKDRSNVKYFYTLDKRRLEV